MDSKQPDRDPAPEEIFRALRDRVPEELDPLHLWRRIDEAIEPRRTSRWARFIEALRVPKTSPAVVGLAAATVLVVVALVLTRPGLVPAPGSGAVDPGPGAASGPAWEIEVRLVRAYEGAVPADALPSGGAGAGGADELAELRDQLQELMRFPDIALVGRWRGAVAREPVGAMQPTADLSDRFVLRFSATANATGVRLDNVQLTGAGRPLVADVIDLTPGRDYVFGVQDVDEESGAGSLALAVRLVPAGPESAVDGVGRR